METWNIKLIEAARAALWLWLACLGLPAHADAAFDTARTAAVAASPAGVSVTLTVAGGKTVFHRGEMIPLTAAFAASVPGRYDLNTDAGSRDLEWNSDSFHADNPAGAVDPLPVYYDHEFGRSYEGPGPRFEPLTAKPLTVLYTLNEWLRFDAPGHYRVYLTSGRVADAAKRHNDLFFSGHAATSNAVEFDVLPDDPAWDAQTLQAALPLFNKRVGEDDYPMQAPQAAAARTIRFLGTPDAARAMIARYRTFSEFNFLNTPAYFETRLGLFGFPQPGFVISEMERRISDPDFPVSEQFIYDLAQAQFLAAYTQTIPHYVAGDPAKEKARQELLRQRLAAMTALQEQERERLRIAAPRKRGRARGASLYALLRLNYQHRNTTEYQNQVRALVQVFDDLTPEQQGSLLDDNGYWPDIRSPALVPLLRRLYTDPQTRSAALRHLIDLSPAEGRVLLLAEIKNPKTQVDLPTLCSLPDRTLPSLDTALAVNLDNSLQQRQGDSSVESRLVERYATAAILPHLKAQYRFYGCDAEANLIAYFLRTDPAYGAAQLKLALVPRAGYGCSRYVLGSVAALRYGPDVERLAVAHLHDPDTQTAADAAKTLGAYGSPAAEAALWQRMREWHREWRGHAAQIEPTENPASETWELEYALTQALATAPGWLLNANQLRALDALCVTSGGHQNIGPLAKDWTVPIGIAYDEGNLWRVAQYGQMPTLAALETKLAQFPRGTRFRLSPFGFSGRAEQAQAFARLKPFLEKRGMSLTMDPMPHPEPK